MMRLGVNIGPSSAWSAIVAAARSAEESGYDAISLLDHYHSEQDAWSWMCGWSVYGALALTTTRIHLVPMVLDRLNYLPGVLAKETAMLSHLSQGRFELGIGAGDYFEEARAWGTGIPPARTRIAALHETVIVLRRIWQAERVTFAGEHVHLTNAACLPPPLTPPRIVVGVGTSRSLLRSAVTYADEINVYADDALIEEAQGAIVAAQRPVALSVYVWDWPENLAEKLAAWEQMGVERTFLTFWPPFETITTTAARFLPMPGENSTAVSDV